MDPARDLLDQGGLDGSDFLLAQRLANNVQAGREEAQRKLRSSSRGNDDRITAVSVFQGSLVLASPFHRLVGLFHYGPLPEETPSLEQ